jgi:hypothetical protein
MNLDKIKKLAKKGFEKAKDQTKKGYEATKKRIKTEIHERKRGIAIDVLYDTKDKVKSSNDKEHLYQARKIVSAKYEKGGSVGKINKERRFTDDDHLKLIKEVFYSVKENNNLKLIKDDKTNEVIAKYYPEKKSLVLMSTNPNSKIAKWLEENSYLSSSEKYSNGGSIDSAKATELKEKLADYEKRAKNPKLPEFAKEKLQTLITGLKKEISEVETVKETPKKAEQENIVDKLMLIDSNIWDKHKWEHAGMVDEKIYNKEITAELKKFPKNIFTQELYDAIEDENYHTLNKKIKELGLYSFLKKETKKQDKPTFTPTETKCPSCKLKEGEKSQKVSDLFDLVKLTDTVHLMRNSEGKDIFEINKKGDKYDVVCLTLEKKVFESLESAVNFVLKQLYETELGAYLESKKTARIAAKKRVNERKKEGKPVELTPAEVVTNATESIKTKLDNLDDKKEIIKQVKVAETATKKLIKMLVVESGTNKEELKKDLIAFIKSL